MQRITHRTIGIFLTCFMLLLAVPATAQFRGRPGGSNDFRGRFGRDFDRDRDSDSDRDSRQGRESDDRDEDDDRDGNRDWGRRGGWGGDREWSRGRSRDRDGDDGQRDWGGNRDWGRGRGYGGPGGDRGDSRGGGRFRFTPESFYGRLDEDGNGRLEGDEIPEDGRARAFLDRAGIQEGATLEDFERGFERVREEGFSRSEDGSSSSDDGRSSNQAAGFTPSEKEAVTLPLPESFVDRDANRDGQIAFHEWREWDWTQLEAFFYLDANGDGFVTPRELAGSDSELPVVPVDRSPVVEDAPPELQLTSAGPPGRKEGIDLDENNEHVRRGREIFRILDANRDGSASVAELGRLNKLRPMFERARIPLNQEMSGDEFAANYYRAATFPVN